MIDTINIVDWVLPVKQMPVDIHSPLPSWRYMKLLKILIVGFLVVLLLFVTFRLITAPSSDNGIVVIIIASALAGITWDEGDRTRCFQRFRRNE